MPYKDQDKRRKKAAEYQRAYRIRRKLEGNPIYFKRLRDYQKYYDQHRPNKAERLKERLRYNKKLRLDVMTAYGGKCVCCGTTPTPFLELDHINGNGKEHRKEMETIIPRGAGYMFYKWLRQNGYPDVGIQVLCRNCHAAKTREGACTYH